MLIILLFSNVIFLSSTIYFFTQNKSNEKNLLSKDEQIKLLNQDLQKFQDEKNNLIHYQGRYEQLEKDTKKLVDENIALKSKNDILLAEKNEVEKDREILKLDKNNLLQEKENWGKDKENLLKKLTLELIQKSSEINEKNSRNNQEGVKKITEELLKNFENVRNKVSSLDDDGKIREKTLSEMKRALLNPGGAGNSSETTLGNILEASGLRQKKSKDEEGDYILQTSFNTNSSDTTKRPDAIVYLPNNNFIVIDSKSSSHFMGLQEAIDNKDREKERIILDKIKSSMNKHLDDLKKKDYQKAQEDYLTKKENSNSSTVMTVMFLQTEKMLDVIRKIDKNFELKCCQANIPLATPLGLINLLNLSKYSINKEKQDKNIGKLKGEIEQLLSNIVSMFKNADGLGKGLKKALTSYHDFAGIMNGKIFTRFNNIKKLGIETKKNIPHKLEQYELATTTIEGEVKEVSEDEEKLLESE